MGRRGMAMLATAWRASSSMVGGCWVLRGWRASLLAAEYGMCVYLCLGERWRERERVRGVGLVLMEG
jgi:hypothetical protein